jgi:hypothetical protein
MTRFTSLVALALACAGPFAPRATAAETSPIAITQDGADLVVKMKVTANNSLHVLWTNTIDSGDTVTLRYYVIQNPDLFVRSQKQVDVEWRVPRRKAGEVKIRVQEAFQPSSADLKALAPQLKELEEVGALWKRLREPREPQSDRGGAPVGAPPR